MFCLNCNIPIIKNCDYCGYKLKNKYCNEGLVVVFKEELEFLKSKIPNEYKKDYIFFRKRNVYYVNGKVVGKRKYVNSQYYLTLISKRLPNIESIKSIEYILDGNRNSLEEIERNSVNFIKFTAGEKTLYLCFSGGKDSVVLYNLAKKAKVNFETISCKIGNEMIKNDFLSSFNLTVLLSKNDFLFGCKKYNYPSFHNRWCSRYKTETTNLYQKRNSIKMLGTRKHESHARILQKKISKGKKNIYIIKPIFEWTSLDVWLYILKNKLKVNHYYKYGIDRTGCFACPFKKKFENYVLNFLESNKFCFWQQVKKKFSKENRKNIK